MTGTTAPIRPAQSSATEIERRLLRNRKYITTIILLVAAGILGLIVAEQIMTGWLALGERANISRRDFNVLEIGAAIGAALWGILCLYSAFGLIRHPSTPSYTDYLENRVGRTSAGVLITLAFLLISALLCLLYAEQLATGWLALGERANISRRDLNLYEIIAILFTVIWAITCLRTFWAIWKRDKRSWPWAQWIALLTALVSVAVVFTGTINIRATLPRNGTVADNLPAAIELVAPGLMLFLAATVVYRYLTLSVGLSADQSVRNQLAKSPSAGAIIGLVTLIVAFSIASPLFLEPRAIAGALSTNVTNGIVAIGITLLMISGEFDLSVGSIFGASALIFLLALTEGVFGLPPMRAIPAAAIALLFAAILGLINGVLLIRTGIPSFIVTLGTLLAYRAITLVALPEGRIIRYADYRLPDPVMEFSPYVLIALLVLVAVILLFLAYRQIPHLWGNVLSRIRNFRENESPFRDVQLIARFIWSAMFTVAIIGLIIGCVSGIIDLLGRGSANIPVSFFDIANGRIASLPVIGPLDASINLRTGVIWWFVLVVIFQFILNHMKYGGYTFAVGGNPGAALAQGISVSRIKITNFIICAVLAGVAGIAFVSRVGSVGPNLGEGLELEVIAASVIGGTLLTGGYGSIFGALLGVLIFGLLRTGLVLIGMDPRIFYGVQGVIIIVAVIINTAVRRVRT